MTELPSGTRPEAGAEKIGAFDQAVADGAVEMLLDDIRLTFFDALEAVRYVNAVADLVRL